MWSSQTERYRNFTICQATGKLNVRPRVQIGFAFRLENKWHRDEWATIHQQLRFPSIPHSKRTVILRSLQRPKNLRLSLRFAEWRYFRIAHHSGTMGEILPQCYCF